MTNYTIFDIENDTSMRKPYIFLFPILAIFIFSCEEREPLPDPVTDSAEYQALAGTYSFAEYTPATCSAETGDLTIIDGTLCTLSSCFFIDRITTDSMYLDNRDGISLGLEYNYSSNSLVFKGASPLATVPCDSRYTKQ